MRLFIVDDDPDVLRALELQLRPVGAELHRFQDPQQALHAAKTKLPNLAVVDFNLPHLSGLELLRRLKELNPNLRTMLITAQDANDEIAQARDERLFDVLLGKPWRMSEIIEKVRELVALAR